MSLRDYAGWNEDALYMWYMEEGRHIEEPPEYEDRESEREDEQTEVNCPYCGYDVLVDLYDYEVSETPCPSCGQGLSIDGEV